MIGTMPAASSANAPRPRPAPWLIAGAVVLTGVIAAAVSAWYWLPWVAPNWVIARSPWTAPVVRACMALDRSTHAGVMTLVDWGATRVPNGCDALMPFLSSRDHETRRIVAGALAMMTALPRRPSFDLWLMPLLSDPDSEIRRAAVLALTDPATIPYLERLGSDHVREVVEAVELTLDRLRGSQPTPAR